MNSSRIFELLTIAPEDSSDAENREILIDKCGVDFDFGEEFEKNVLTAISREEETEKKDNEFVISMNRVFYRIAFTGVAAIVLMLLSIFLSEGSISVNSFLGLGNNYEETTICLLTDNLK